MAVLGSLWKTRQLSIAYSGQPWEPLASPAHLVTGADVLAHATAHFATVGEHSLVIVEGNSTRTVSDNEAMSELPLAGGEVLMRLVKTKRVDVGGS